MFSGLGLPIGSGLSRLWFNSSNVEVQSLYEQA